MCPWTPQRGAGASVAILAPAGSATGCHGQVSDPGLVLGPPPLKQEWATSLRSQNQHLREGNGTGLLTLGENPCRADGRFYGHAVAFPPHGGGPLTALWHLS